MADELTLEIVTPEKLAFSDMVQEVTIPGSEGEFGVLVGHVPLLSAVNYGEMNFTKEGKKSYYAVGTGYVEVTDVKVTLLVESAERADMIDAGKAQKDKEAAEAELAKLNKEDPGYLRAANAFKKADVRLKVAEKK